jgi:hypothetical protein
VFLQYIHVVAACHCNDRSILTEHNKVILRHSGSVTRILGVRSVAAISYCHCCLADGRWLHRLSSGDGGGHSAAIRLSVGCSCSHFKFGTRLRFMGWGSNTGRDHIFRVRLYRLWGTSSLSYKVKVKVKQSHCRP